MTLRHVVAWKLAAEDDAVRREHAQQLTDALLALKGVVPELIDITVGADVLGEGNWDVALVADVKDADALAAYQEHPAHQAVVGFVRSVVSDRVAVDFER